VNAKRQTQGSCGSKKVSCCSHPCSARDARTQRLSLQKSSPTDNGVQLLVQSGDLHHDSISDDVRWIPALGVCVCREMCFAALKLRQGQPASTYPPSLFKPHPVPTHWEEKGKEGRSIPFVFTHGEGKGWGQHACWGRCSLYLFFLFMRPSAFVSQRISAAKRRIKDQQTQQRRHSFQCLPQFILSAGLKAPPMIALWRGGGVHDFLHAEKQTHNLSDK